METRNCPNCQMPFEGRSDKIFCSRYCKSNFNYQRDKNAPQTRFKQVDQQLKLNRNILRKFNRSGKSTVRQEELFAEGFNPKYLTNYWKNKHGQTYLFCYEYGFLATHEREIPKYVLIKWQTYMS